MPPRSVHDQKNFFIKIILGKFLKKDVKANRIHIRNLQGKVFSCTQFNSAIQIEILETKLYGDRCSFPCFKPSMPYLGMSAKPSFVKEKYPCLRFFFNATS
jgi:hypothetical protein